MTDALQIPVTTPGADAAAQALRSVASALGGVSDKATSTAFSFNQIRAAVTSLVGDFAAFADRVAALSSEQAQLDANSARLGLNFDAAAEAAGRFTDETDAMAAASRLAEAGIRLTQEQLESLTRVAGSFAQNTGVSTREAVDKLTMGLLTGAQEGLRPFGGELRAVAGETRTAEQRLAALTAQAGHTAQATDDARSSMERLRDSIGDASRAMAAGFTDGLSQMAEVSQSTETAGNRFEVLTEDIRNAGRIMGQVVVGIGNGLAIVVGTLATGIASMLSQVVGAASAAGAVIDRVRSGNLSGLMGAARSAYESSLADSPITAGLARFTAGRVEAGERILGALGEGGAETAAAGSQQPTRPRTPRPGGGGRSDDVAKSAKAAQMLLDQQQRELDERRRVEAEDYRRRYAESVRQRGIAEEERQKERLRAQSDREKAESAEGARATREAQREQRLLQRRLDATQSFNERMRDLYSDQVDIAREGAEGVAATFQITGKALADHAKAYAAGRETMAEAAEGILSDILTNLGEQAFVKSAFYFAEGLGNIATLNFPGAAAAFAASAAFGVVGGLATAAGAAVAPSASPSASGASTAPAQPAARVSRGSSSGEGGGTIINVAFGGPMYGTGGVRQAARQIGGVLNQGARQGGVQLMPGALMGGGAGS